MFTLRTRFVGVVLCFSLPLAFSCGPATELDEPPLEGPLSPRGDEPTPADGGFGFDAGLVEPRDAGGEVPVGEPETPDAGDDGGAPSEVDAGIATDAGTAFDAGTTFDAGMAFDAGTAFDAGPAFDAGLRPDAGATLDAGPRADAGVAPPPPPGDGGLWVTGYYPGWVRGTLPPSAIDYAALTHLVDFSLHPRADGTLEDTHQILPSSATTIAAAHAGGVKVLMCLGGANTVAGFRGATTSANLATFVDNIVNVVTARGYDGVDLDWEPLVSSDRPQYVALVNALQARLAALNPRRQLTAAVDSWAANTMSLVANRFDQINVMTYDMAGTGSDWVSWFNSPLSNGGALRPSGAPLPAADLSVQSFRNAGLPAARLGIGIAFYGNLWSGGAGTTTGGVSAPRQRWTTAPAVSPIDYRAIMSTWYQPGLVHHDPDTGAAWLGLDRAGAVDDRFLTWDDESTIALKLAWTKTNRLGGVIIWQLGGGYLPSAPAGQRDPLLQAVRAHR